MSAKPITDYEIALAECYEKSQRADWDELSEAVETVKPDAFVDLMQICKSADGYHALMAYKVEVRRLYCEFLMKRRGFES